jgi:hypothetical protein
LLRSTEAQVANGLNKLSYDAVGIVDGYYVLTVTTSKGSYSRTVRVAN